MHFFPWIRLVPSHPRVVRLSTIPHCLEWYKFVARTRLFTPAVLHLVQTSLIRFNEKLLENKLQAYNI